MKTFRIGTRGSKLALVQTEHVIELLKKKSPSVNLELVIIKTEGDIDQSTALEKIGGVGLFTKQIEKALLDNEIDIAVHSAKDLPSVMTAGLAIGAVPEREDSRDAWLSREGKRIDKIDQGAKVGTSSPRRRAQLYQLRPDLKVMDIRGNVDTRLRKLEDGKYDAIMMALAGLKRLGLEKRVTEIMPLNKMLPAPGQGFLLVQARADDRDAAKLTGIIDNAGVRRCLEIERLLLAGLNAGCSAAVGGIAEDNGDDIVLNAVVLDKLGKNRLFRTNRIKKNQEDSALVDPVVKYMFANGAKKLIDDAGK